MSGTVSRRDFLKIAGELVALMGLSTTAIPKIAEALSELSSGRAPVLWLQGQSCSGCSVSLLNVDGPNVLEVLTNYICLSFHSSLSVATGNVGMQIIDTMVNKGGFILVVEGSIPETMPTACSVGGEHLTDQVARAARAAKAVVAVGACAAFGGIPAAENNPTGALGVPAYLEKCGITTPLIAIPGCPVHPDWLVGTIAHVLKVGIPRMDAEHRPLMFFERTVHEQCQRFRDYEREIFAHTFGEKGCLFKLGCAGPTTKADCSIRQWNSGVNYCINAGAPCIGCASETFALKTDFPLFTKERAKSSKEN